MNKILLTIIAMVMVSCKSKPPTPRTEAQVVDSLASVVEMQHNGKNSPDWMSWWDAVPTSFGEGRKFEYLLGSIDCSNTLGGSAWATIYLMFNNTGKVNYTNFGIGWLTTVMISNGSIARSQDPSENYFTAQFNGGVPHRYDFANTNAENGNRFIVPTDSIQQLQMAHFQDSCLAATTIVLEIPIEGMGRQTFTFVPAKPYLRNRTNE